MLKFIIVGAIFATVSAAPLESKPSEKSTSDNTPITHIQSLLVRPSPINPDIPMDPKPPERIILDDTKTEREQRSTYDNDKLSSHEHDSHENSKSVHEHGDESKDDKSHSDNKHEENSHEVHNNDKSNDHQSGSYEHHDHKRESDLKVPAESDLALKELAQPKELVHPNTSGEPTIVYAKKADEKRSATDGFQTSHRIPDVDESERMFETSHHIPSHVEEERTKVVENAKVGQKPLNQ